MFLINKKKSCIPPLFYNKKFISNFRDKAELFNNFLAQQCTLIDNTSEISAALNIKTTKTLSSIPVTRANVAKMIKNFDANKAHGHAIISIRTLKLCGESVLPPLELTFKSCLEFGTPISFHPICEKIFERLPYNKMFQYFIEDNLISHKRSPFKRGDSCINQMLSTTRGI